MDLRLGRAPQEASGVVYSGRAGCRRVGVFLPSVTPRIGAVRGRWAAGRPERCFAECPGGVQ